MPITQDRFMTVLTVADEFIKRLDDLRYKLEIAVSQANSHSDNPKVLLEIIRNLHDEGHRQVKIHNLAGDGYATEYASEIQLRERFVREKTHFETSAKHNTKNREAVARWRNRQKLRTTTLTEIQMAERELDSTFGPAPEPRDRNIIEIDLSSGDAQTGETRDETELPKPAFTTGAMISRLKELWHSKSLPYSRDQILALAEDLGFVPTPPIMNNETLIAELLANNVLIQTPDGDFKVNTQTPLPETGGLLPTRTIGLKKKPT